MTKQQVRLRYAPSPTGKLHIGGARTALFNYLYAKNRDGLFIIRIEDTDIERNIENGESEQIDNLKWLGILPDIYPGKNQNFPEFEFMRQSERIHIYNKYVDELLKSGHAYECYCSHEELEQEREKQKQMGIVAPKYSRKCLNNQSPKEGITPLIRLKMPSNKEISWNDGVRGKISFNSNDIEDWVIRKSNGIPTYNFANVIDDHLMKITHVFRGEEHVSNTPKQVHLYEIFNWEMPNFSHLTIILGNNNKKLSKRDETIIQFISDYKDRGYLKEAIFNFLALLGWSPKVEKEIFTQKELIDIFNISGLSNAPSKFDIDKLKWTNNYYIQRLTQDEAYEFLNRFIPSELFSIYSQENISKIIELFRPQLREGLEINDLSKIFITKKEIGGEEIQFMNSIPKISLLLDSLSAILKIPNESWSAIEIKEVIKNIGIDLGLKGKELFMPIRIILTGQNHGPDLMEIIAILGKEEVKKRINEK